MNEPDLPSESDASDDDYRPAGEESEPASEEESGLDDETVDNNDSEDDDCNKPNRKTSKKGKKNKNVKRKTSKRTAPTEELSDNKIEIVKEETHLDAEEKKKKADSLWADFMKDCGGPPRKKQSLDSCSTGCSDSNLDKTSSCSNKESLSPSTSSNKTIKTDEKENKSTVTEIFEFAGEKVSVEREVPTNSVSTDNGTQKHSTVGLAVRGHSGKSSKQGGGGSSALSSFLSQLGKKGKLSTLEKSKLDWDQFKKKEGIEDEIHIHNKGKDGYLEKQDFLQRTDVRRFEIEKAFRQKRSGR